MRLNRAEMNDDYPVRIWFDAEGGVYVAEFLDLPGCFAPGTSVEEAYRRAQEAKGDWIRIAKEQGLPIPPPSKSDEYSGRILLRLPTAMHGILANRAKDQATSLNQYAVHLLSGAVVGDIVTSQFDQLGDLWLLHAFEKVAKGPEDGPFGDERHWLEHLASTSPFPSTSQKIGGAYAAVRSSAGTSDRVH